MFSITPNLKQIGSQVSWHMPMWNTYFINHVIRILSLEYYLYKKKTTNQIQHELQQTKRLWQHSEFHPDRYLNLQDNRHQSFLFHFLLQLWPWMKIQGNPNWHQNVEHSGLYHHPKFKRNPSVNVWIQASVKVGFFLWNHISRILSWIFHGQDKMHPRRRNVTTLMIGLKNDHIRKNLTQKWWTPEI